MLVRITPWRKKKSERVPKIVEVHEDFQAPLIINCGMGTDSVFMLHKAYREGIKPDLVIFADTKAEKKRTYEVVEEVRQLVQTYWDMSLVVVTRTDVYPLREGGHTYSGITENCLANKTLPSLAYKRHSCSIKYKKDVMDRWIEMYFEPAMIAWELGMKATKWIGYDASPADLKRSKIAEDDRYRYVYPIRDAGETRTDCVDSIEYEQTQGSCVGQPGKSACFFCPACKTHEIFDLAKTEPDKLAQALLIENTALSHTLDIREDPVTTFGLGGMGTWNWNLFLEIVDPELLKELDARYETGSYKRKLIFKRFQERSVEAQRQLRVKEDLYAYQRDNEAKSARNILRRSPADEQALAFIAEYKELQKSLPQLRVVATGLGATHRKADDYLDGIREEVSGGGF